MAEPIKLRFTEDNNDFFPKGGWGVTPQIAGLIQRRSLEVDGGSVRDVLVVLPCGHRFRSQGKWEISHYDSDENITLTPSILCMGKEADGKPSECWHGYITNGELVG